MIYPHIRISGSPSERGRAYGVGAGKRVRRSMAGYEATFRARGALEWNDARAIAKRYLPAIAAYHPDAVSEMQGLAEGASVDFDDVLTLNCRTEIMAVAIDRASAAAADLLTAADRKADGCSAAAVTPEATGGPTIVAQNWDWLVHSARTVVMVEVVRDDGPNYVTAVEAGLLAKTGMNSCGIGITTNFLLSRDDVGAVGVPYHVTLRALMDAETLPDALDILQRPVRSSSANYLLAHRSGTAVNIEAFPGGFEALRLSFPAGGVLAHTNHYCTDVPDGDLSMRYVPCSPFRLNRLEGLLRRPGLVDVTRVQEALSDHANYPTSLCAHGDLRTPAELREATALSIVMVLDDWRISLADGNPCATAYRDVDYSALLSQLPAGSYARPGAGG